jgi:hypothetical protein
MGLSSFSSSFCAAGSNSIVHFGFETIAAHHFFKWDGTNASGANLCEALLGEVDILKLFKVLKDGFTGVICLGAPCPFGESVKALLDAFGKTDGKHEIAPAIQL